MGLFESAVEQGVEERRVKTLLDSGKHRFMLSTRRPVIIIKLHEFIPDFWTLIAWRALCDSADLKMWLSYQVKVRSASIDWSSKRKLRS